jgi:hypothetical protein
MAYWAVIWGAFMFPVADAIRFFDVDNHLRATDGSLMQWVWVLCACIIGAGMGAASGASLGIVQLLVLRRYVLGAGRWFAGLVAGNAVVIGSLFALWLWGTRWGWN